MNRSTQARMGRKTIIVVWLVVLALVPFHLAEAQQQAKIPKIGRLSPTSLASGGQREFLGRELHALGYVEGKNIAIEYRYADNKLDRLPALAEELVGLKVDVFVVTTTPATLALKNATRTIPIVFFRVSDPVAVGLIDSLARPGGNITGVTNIAPVLAGKRLELLKETIPELSRAAVLWNPKDPASTQQWKESQLSARELGLQLHSMEVSSADKYEGAFKEAIKARSAALAVTDHALAVSNQKQIADLATKNRLPAIYGQVRHVDSGGLMSYGADEAEIYRRVASMVDKILKGTMPADIPVEQPTKFEFIINLKAAKQIGLTVPPNVLYRADKVIK
jgi:putative tryptophan/tyrosine transport system substrate-binding protein